MNIITNLVTTVDDVTAKYILNTIQFIAEPIQVLLVAIGTLTFFYIIINHFLQFAPISMAALMGWAVRYVLIFMFVTTWSEFEPVFKAVRSIPEDYGSLLIQASAEAFDWKVHRPDIFNPDNAKISSNHGMDEIIHAMFWISADYIRDITITDVGLTMKHIFFGIVFIIAGGIFAAVSAFIICFSKIGFAIAMGLAPLALVMLMSEHTKQYFQNWLQFTLGFLIMQLMIAALVSLMIFICSEIVFLYKPDSDHKDEYWKFAFIVVCALIYLTHVNTLASSLAGSSVVAAGSSLASAQRIMNGAKRLGRQGTRASDGARAFGEARRSGHGVWRSMRAGAGGMLQGSMTRQGKRDNRREERIKYGTRKYKHDERKGTVSYYSPIGTSESKNSGSSAKSPPASSGSSSSGSGASSSASLRSSPRQSQRPYSRGGSTAGDSDDE